MVNFFIDAKIIFCVLLYSSAAASELNRDSKTVLIFGGFIPESLNALMHRSGVAARIHAFIIAETSIKLDIDTVALSESSELEMIFLY